MPGPLPFYAGSFGVTSLFLNCLPIYGCVFKNKDVTPSFRKGG